MKRLALMLALMTGPAGAQSPAASLGDGFKANADKPLDIEADALEVDDKRKLATFKGAVVARQGDFTLRAAEITVTYTPADAAAAPASSASPVASAMAAPMGGGGADISRIEAKGKVDVTAKDQRSLSDSAVFEVKKQQVTISGNVTLTQGKNVLRGERMVIDLTTGLTKMDAGGLPAGRLKAIFTPKPKEGAKAPAATAPPAPAPAAAPARDVPQALRGLAPR